MADGPFPICSTTIPPCIGRSELLERMTRALTKGVPDHLQVTGPQFAGKTVLLNELAVRLRNFGSRYQAVLLWDLAHLAAASDEQFVHVFGKEIANALRANKPTYAEHLEALPTISAEDLAEVLDALSEEGSAVLTIWDRFDRPAVVNTLSRNLWDQLRELASKPSLRLVVASRKRLSELIRNPEAETSPFWNIFNQVPVEVGPFDAADIDAALERMPDLRLSNGARTELWNATNGSSLMVLEVLNTLAAHPGSSEVSAELARGACAQAFPALRDRIGLLWQQCSVGAKDLFLRVHSEGPVARQEAAPVDVDALAAFGFIQAAGNKLQRANGLLCRYLEERPQEDGALARLFGPRDAYRANLRNVLERRIAQIHGLDSRLKRYLEQGAKDLPEFPQNFLTNVHGILEQALALIWRAECWNEAKNRPAIPSAWFDVWARNKDRQEEWRTRFPEGGQRLRLLDMMTGNRSHDRCARYVTKNSYVLANALQGFRDFGVHSKSASIDLGTAYVALHTGIELGAALAEELPG